ncbi:MAG TPA: cytochrome c-type biogenesis CcmF C-terminal domain-containing protein [Acidimicrobiales bacterium]|jgi:cytochrome c-type biogenesis protein CcmF|nr:cytochrome c-type biogenesis CcmF C-terminal domain-containing protein [Acidimicrobiales bacterium]
MSAALGSAGIILGFVASLGGIATLAVGLARGRKRLLVAGRTYVWLVAAGAVVTFAAMEYALLSHDFSVAFVANNSSRHTPFPFNVATLWSALEGSIILWATVLSGYLVVTALKFRSRATDPLVGWATLTMLAVSLFFFGLMLPNIGPADPFKATGFAIPPGFDGPGPNALLQNHILMAFHPPMLYLGYVGFTVPFAFAIAALVTGRLGEGWLLETRRWTLFAWGFLSIGIVLGAWWSYEVLGWGGAWAWDPVENASFLPWLTGTAYLHSVMVQERRGMLRVWNLTLLCATFALTILGTFLTRSGVLDSVHAFTESGIGVWVLSFFAVIVLVTIGLIGWRGDRLRAPGRIDSPLSREGAFLFNNLFFAVFAFAVLLGTVWPLIVEAVNGERLSVGRPWFDFFGMVLGLGLLLLMAVAPVLPWRKTTTETLAKRLQWPAWTGVTAIVFAVLVHARGLAPLAAFGLGGFAAGAAVRQVALATRRQGWRGLVGRTNGGMIVHLGVVVLVVGYIASTTFQTSREVRLTPNQTITIEGHTLQYLGSESDSNATRTSVGARIRVDGGKTYAPQLRRFPNNAQAIGTPSVRTGLVDDVYLSLLTAPDDSNAVNLRIIIEPLAVWMWIGGAVIAFGTLLAAWPGRRRDPTDPVSAPVRTERLRDEPERPLAGVD